MTWSVIEPRPPAPRADALTTVLREGSPKIMSVLKQDTEFMGKLPEKKKKAIDSAVMNMIVKDMRPLSMVEGEGFRNLMHVMDSRWDS